MIQRDILNGRLIQRDYLKKYDGYSIFLDHAGYERIYIDGKEILFHVYLWEKFNGKKTPEYDVHHINGIKTDNVLGNFELLSNGDHQKVHAGWVRENGIFVAKPCVGCNSILPLDDFYKARKDGRSALCKKCHATVTDVWKKKNPEKRKKIALDYYYRNRDKQRATDAQTILGK